MTSFPRFHSPLSFIQLLLFLAILIYLHQWNDHVLVSGFSCASTRRTSIRQSFILDDRKVSASDCRSFETLPSVHPRFAKNADKLSHSMLQMTALSSSSHLEEQPTLSATTTDKKRAFDLWWKPTIAIAIPAWIGMMADPLLSLMDTAFVGRVGVVELAALGACTSIFHLAFNVFRATTTATTSLVASSRSDDERNLITSLSLGLGLVLGCLVTGILQQSSVWCLARMGIAPDSPLSRPAMDYLQTRAWAGPAVLGLTVAEGAFRGCGDTRIPLLASAAAAVLNIILDPILMFSLKWNVMGAAAATAISQVGALAVYGYFLQRRRMITFSYRAVTKWLASLKFSIWPFRKRALTSKAPSQKDSTATTTPLTIIKTILGANLAMVAKQGSLLLGWAYATSKATRLGPAHVAAHQVSLSFWLVFALWLDGVAVAAQVLISQTMKKEQEQQEKEKANENELSSDNQDVTQSKKKSQLGALTRYMIQLAAGQGILSTLVMLALGTVVPSTFTTDLTIRRYLKSLMLPLSLQQLLISLTLVCEALVAGANQFQLLAWGTLCSTVLAVSEISKCTTVTQIWSRGIVSLFVGRLVTALFGIVKMNQLVGMPLSLLSGRTQRGEKKHV